MPCHAMHPIQDLFLESFSYELQLDMHSYLHKNFILAKSGCYSLGPRENRFEPRHFGYGPRPHHGDHFPRRPGFPARGSFIHLEPRHLDGPRFPHRGLRPTRPSGEV
jgi:hypothetical protein